MPVSYYSHKQLCTQIQPSFSFAEPPKRRPWFVGTSVCRSQPRAWKEVMASMLEHPATGSPAQLDSPGPLAAGGDTALANGQHCAEVSLSVQERCSWPPGCLSPPLAFPSPAIHPFLGCSFRADRAHSQSPGATPLGLATLGTNSQTTTKPIETICPQDTTWGDSLVGTTVPTWPCSGGPESLLSPPPSPPSSCSWTC